MQRQLYFLSTSLDVLPRSSMSSVIGRREVDAASVACRLEDGCTLGDGTFFQFFVGIIPLTNFKHRRPNPGRSFQDHQPTHPRVQPTISRVTHQPRRANYRCSEHIEYSWLQPPHPFPDVSECSEYGYYPAQFSLIARLSVSASSSPSLSIKTSSIITYRTTYSRFQSPRHQSPLFPLPPLPLPPIPQSSVKE